MSYELEQVRIQVVPGARPSLRLELKTFRDRSNPNAQVSILGYSFQLLVKRDLEDADSLAWVDVDGVVDADGEFVDFQLTPAHSFLPDGTWPGVLRWWGPPPDAPETTLSCGLAGAGAGNVDDGVHYYGYTNVSDAGESAVSAISSSVTVADKTVNGKVSLTSIDVGPAGTTARRIYRTVAGADPALQQFKLVAEIADNVTTTYEDNVADASLGAVVEYDGTASRAYPVTDALPVQYQVLPQVGAI